MDFESDRDLPIIGATADGDLLASKGRAHKFSLKIIQVEIACKT